MNDDDASGYSGGCQCGAVRFRIEGTPGRASVCHCRMCQKASGNFYLPLVSLGDAALTWTRGGPKRFRSSNHVWRGFCGDCGTPLFYEAPDGLALTIAAFDQPERIVPTIQWGIESKLSYVDSIPSLHGKHTSADPESASFLATLVSYQHPDHDTEHCPPAT